MARHKRKEVVMNTLEKIARLVMRIRDLREKIGEEKDVKATWLERLELGALRVRLNRMKKQLVKEA